MKNTIIMAEQTKSIKGTRTEKLLADSYLAESTAYTRYTFFAKQAYKESYFQVSNVFTETADNELHHAKIFLKFLNEEAVVSDPIKVDAGVIGSTADNLAVAAEEEKEEGVEAYQKAAAVALEEGFPEIAAKFKAIATIEEHHRQRFERLRRHILDGTMWKRPEPIKWQCLVCGYIFEGTEPPKVCPACDHPYQHYKPLSE